ncbi:flagella basal body P-ring formation protein FlgA [Staphylococcus epidermidis]|nr:flagella basal body P-ring formation protein FlgA [Staphylococcus epidermidis]
MQIALRIDACWAVFSIHHTPPRQGLAAAWGIWGIAAMLLSSSASAQDGAAQLNQIDSALSMPPCTNLRPMRRKQQRHASAHGSADGQLDLPPAAGRLRQGRALSSSRQPSLGPHRLGLRCVEGSVPWNVFLPITVRAYGPAWVAQGNIPAGKVLSAEDAVPAEVDWAEDSAPVFANAEDFVGMVAARPLASGQTLRQNMVRTLRCSAPAPRTSHGQRRQLSASPPLARPWPLLARVSKYGFAWIMAAL